MTPRGFLCQSLYLKLFLQDPQDRACMQLAGTNGQVIYLLTVGAHPDFQRQVAAFLDDNFNSKFQWIA
jgi:hypothetical protein